MLEKVVDLLVKNNLRLNLENIKFVQEQFEYQQRPYKILKVLYQTICMFFGILVNSDTNSVTGNTVLSADENLSFTKSKIG